MDSYRAEITGRLICMFSGSVIGAGFVMLVAMCDPARFLTSEDINPWKIAFMAVSLCLSVLGAFYLVRYGTPSISAMNDKKPRRSPAK